MVVWTSKTLSPLRIAAIYIGIPANLRKQLGNGSRKGVPSSSAGTSEEEKEA